MEKKELSMFAVLDSMPENTTAIFTSTKNGKSLGKKHNNNAIIEVVVDNDTFQDFAFQKMYGEAKSKGSKKYFMFLSIDAEVYEKHRKLLHAKKTATIYQLGQGIQNSFLSYPKSQNGRLRNYPCLRTISGKYYLFFIGIPRN